MIRKPVVAGSFYSESEKALLNEIKSLVEGGLVRQDAIGVVSPHAGYIYSGGVAASVLGSITPKPDYIILGPNHTGLGEEFSISTAESWRTPLGEVQIDSKLAETIKKNSKFLTFDELAHIREHSVEVQLPFLQVLHGDFVFVPLVISPAPLAVYREIGKAIAQAVRQLGLEDKITIIASSDMTHYEPHEDAKDKDGMAIDAILSLDENSLIDKIRKFNISMCGYAPVAVMLTAVKELGAKGARLVKYRTSGDVSGDYSSVVGYAGIIISR